MEEAEKRLLNGELSGFKLRDEPVEKDIIVCRAPDIMPESGILLVLL
ncbi:MAG: hypothetical protein H7320_09645 [Ferruginibacter sp.]|nr:hypothetical protein [Ferruginibacter sp.]